jgi:isoquinoline 1-oxidoreductase beta subunit
VKKTIRGRAAKLSRRTFIVGSAAAGGGLALGFNLPPGFGPAVAQSAGEGAEVNAWVFIKPDDTCVIRVARAAR